MATCTHCSKRIKQRNSVGVYWCRSHGAIRRAEAAWLERMQLLGWPESCYSPTSIYARWNMPEYICEFTDGSYSAVEVTGGYGRGDLIGVATRGDGKKRVVFFQDHPNNGLLIPRDGDPWIHNIRRANVIKMGSRQRELTA